VYILLAQQCYIVGYHKIGMRRHLERLDYFKQTFIGDDVAVAGSTDVVIATVTVLSDNCGRFAKNVIYVQSTCRWTVQRDSKSVLRSSALTEQREVDSE